MKLEWHWHKRVGLWKLGMGLGRWGKRKGGDWHPGMRTDWMTTHNQKKVGKSHYPPTILDQSLKMCYIYFNLFSSAYHFMYKCLFIFHLILKHKHLPIWLHGLNSHNYKGLCQYLYHGISIIPLVSHLVFPNLVLGI